MRLTTVVHAKRTVKGASPDFAILGQNLVPVSYAKETHTQDTAKTQYVNVPLFLVDREWRTQTQRSIQHTSADT